MMSCKQTCFVPVPTVEAHSHLAECFSSGILRVNRKVIFIITAPKGISSLASAPTSSAISGDSTETITN